MTVLLEVNIGEEKSKSGIFPTELKSFYKEIPSNPWVTIAGLMTLPPYHDDPEKVRPYFKRMKVLADELSLHELSMGMSHDFEIAIREGATQVRIGEGIFGKRITRG